MTTRRSTRVLCLDPDDRVLMLRWRDPVDDHLLWEPPGGGIDPGETPEQAAVRELSEETGLTPSWWSSNPTPVGVDVMWKGQRYHTVEPYFLARVDTARPPLSREGLLDYEATSLVEHAWVAWNEVEFLPGEITPPDVPGILRRLDATGPWATA